MSLSVLRARKNLYILFHFLFFIRIKKIFKITQYFRTLVNLEYIIYEYVSRMPWFSQIINLLKVNFKRQTLTLKSHVCIFLVNIKLCSDFKFLFWFPHIHNIQTEFLLSHNCLCGVYILAWLCKVCIFI